MRKFRLRTYAAFLALIIDAVVCIAAHDNESDGLGLSCNQIVQSLVIRIIDIIIIILTHFSCSFFIVIYKLV